jgi:branched-chain amino acid transport system ATP-binding protein
MRLLEVSNLTKRFGGLVAVNDVSFHIEQGEILGLVGPNGSGKSVLFNTITGIYRNNGGQVVLKNERIENQSPHVITEKGIGRTFQDGKVFPEFTVLQNVMVGRHCRTKSHLWGAILKTSSTRREVKETHEKAMQTLELIGLGVVEARDVPVKSLDFVKRSLVGISIAMATEPLLLLLDEPLAGMNPSEISNAMELILRIRDAGVTILLVEHNMKAIMGVCERIMVLNKGDKIAEGTPQEISQRQDVIEAYLGRGFGAENRGN